MKTLKTLLLATILLPLLLVVILVIWVSNVSPAQFLPLVEEQLRSQNIEAKFSGEASWSFYPNIGLEINQVTIRQRGDTNRQALASIGSARFSVQLLPLLKKQILINGVSLSDSNIFLSIDKQGNSNWQHIAAVESEPEAQPDNAPSSAPLPSLQISQLEIAINELLYKDESASQSMTINNFLVHSKNINVEGKAFPFAIKFTGKLDQFPSANVNLKANAALKHEQSSISIQELTLHISPSSKKGETLQLKADAELSYEEAIEASGELVLQPINLKAFLSALDISLGETTNKSSFSKLAITTPFEWRNNELALSKAQVIFDETKMEGITKIKLSDDPKKLPITRSHWNIDSINIDHYLPPPPPEGSVPATQTNKEPPPVAVELPFELLNSLDLDSSLTINTLTYNDEKLENGKIGLSSKSGITNLSVNFSQAYEGSLDLKSKLDAQKKPAKLSIEGSSQGLNTGKLIKSFADFENIAGLSSSQFNAQSSGSSDLDLIDNLQAKINVTSKELRFNPINLEQQYCKALALLEQKTFDNAAWEAFTLLSPVEINAIYQNNTIQLQNFTGQIHTLATGANGSFNLSSGDFNFPVSLALSDIGKSIKRCSSVSEKWQSKQIPIICKGNIDSIGAGTCLPDLQALKTVVKGKIDQRVQREKDKAEEKIAKKREEAKKKASDKIEQEAGKMVDKETSDKLEDAWKNLIKKR